MNFEQLVTIITDTHQQLQQSAVKAVNQCQTVRYWLIGFYIVEFEQIGEVRAQYGEQLLKKLELLWTTIVTHVAVASYLVPTLHSNIKN